MNINFIKLYYSGGCLFPRAVEIIIFALHKQTLRCISEVIAANSMSFGNSFDMISQDRLSNKFQQCAEYFVANNYS